LTAGLDRRRLARSALTVLAVVLLVVAGVYVRVVLTARSAVQEAEASLVEGNTDDALFHFRRAAHAHAPFNPFNEQAHDRLWQIGRKAELNGDTDGALQAYRAIRSSILAARSFYTPHPERLEEVNNRIARLMARQTPPPVDRDKTEGERMHEHHALLSDNPQPDPMWSLLLLLGFVCWVGACFAFVMVGLDRTLNVRRKPALVAGAVFVCGLALWIAGMILA
jgi:hypothetical protein